MAIDKHPRPSVASDRDMRLRYLGIRGDKVLGDLNGKQFNARNV
jgi:hypothetical protein